MRVARILLTLVVLLAGTGGSCSPPGRAPVPAPTGDAVDTRPVNDPDSRNNVLDVDPGLSAQSMTFVDADTGYVLFADCEHGCRGALYVTVDGGRSWLARPLPTSAATRLGLDVVDARTVVLVTGAATDWYLSTDGGRTFRVGGTGPPPPAAVQRGVMAGCADVTDCTVRVLADGRAVPTQPQLRGDLRAAARAGSGPIWAASVFENTIHTARSADSGRTWQPFGPPLPVDDASAVRLDVSPDGADVWLGAGPGTDAPATYVAENEGWRLVAPGRSLGLVPTASAAVGNGVLAIAGSRFGYLYRDGHFMSGGIPQRVQALRTLRDGTLLVVSGANDVWLGVGTAADRRWIYVRVDAA